MTINIWWCFLQKERKWRTPLQNWTQESISTPKRSVHDHSIIDIFLGSLNLLIFVPVLQMKWSLMYLYQKFQGWLSPSSLSQPVGKQGAVVAVWFVVDCFWDLTEMEPAGSNVVILLYSGDILLVIRQTVAAQEYVTFWKYNVVVSNIFMPMRMMGHLKRGLIVLHSIAERQNSPMSKICGLHNSWHSGTALVKGFTMVHSTFHRNNANST